MKKWKWVVSLLCALICMLGISMHAFAMVQQVSLSNHSGYEAFSNVFSPVPDVGNCYSAFIDTSDVPWEDFGHDYRTLWDSFLSSYLNNNSYRIYFTFSDYASRDPSGELFYFFSINVTPVSGFSSGIDFSSTNKKVQVRPSQLLSCSFRLDSDGVCRPYGKWGIQTLYGMPTGQTYLDNCSDLFSASNITYNYPIFSDLDALFFTDDLGHSFSIESTDFSVVPLLKIVYQYEDGTQAAQPVMRSLIAGDSYEITSPIIEDFTADKPVVSGTMPEEDLTVTVTYTADPPPEPQTYTLTVNYRYENGSQAAQPVTRSLTTGSSYEITSPAIEGYTADKPVVSGTMPAEDLIVTVTYTAVPPPEPQTYTLTVNYRYENGSQAAQPVTRSLTAGSSYEITSPAIEGYTADKPVVSGTMPAEDLIVTVTYTAVPPPEPQTYTLTVNYRYENGSQAAQPITRSLTAGSSYEITSPTIKNYTADRVVVSGIMPERDLTVHVLYRKDSSGSSSSSGKFPDVAAGVEWKDPLTWFDIAEGVEWKDPLTWFDIADGVEWKDPLTWFDIAEGVEWIDPFNYDWG